MNILNELGTRVDNDLNPDSANPGGYFESAEIIGLNEKILRLIGVSWHTLFFPGAQTGWYDDAALTTVKQRVAECLTQKARQSTERWGLKDPRICLLLPLYQQLFEQCNISPIYVLCIRDPRSVAISLKRRNNFPAILSELLWVNHTINALQTAGPRIKAVVHYEKWFRDGDQQVRALAGGVGLRGSLSEERCNAAVQRMIDPALDHGVGEDGSFALDSVESIYRHILAQDYDAAIRESHDIERALDWGMHRVTSSQVFWRTKEQHWFNEANSQSLGTVVSPERRVNRISIPAQDEPVARLRLDPAIQPGLVHLFAIRVLASNGTILWEWDGQLGTLLGCERHDMTLLANVRGGVLVRFDGRDPQIVLPMLADTGSLSEGGVLEFELAWLGETSMLAPSHVKFADGLAKTLRAEAADLRQTLARQAEEIELLRPSADGRNRWKSWLRRATAPVRRISSSFLD